jgi:hypothetical protein
MAGEASILELEAVREQLSRLQRQVDALQMGPPPSGGGWVNELEAASLSGTQPVIDSEAGTAGTAGTAADSGRVSALKLVGNPGDVEDDARAHAGLRFYKKTAGAGGARLGQGVQPKVYASPGEVVATKQPMGVDVGGVYGQVSAVAGNVIDVADDGLYYDGTPAAHKTSHENGGADEISIAGLSGEAADVQPPKIDGLTAEASVAATDTFPFYDASATANRKVTAANLKSYVLTSHGFTSRPTSEAADTTFTNDSSWHEKDWSAITGAAKAILLVCTATGGNVLMRHADDSGDGFMVGSSAMPALPIVVPAKDGVVDYNSGANPVSVQIIGWWL